MKAHILLAIRLPALLLAIGGVTAAGDVTPIKPPVAAARFPDTKRHLESIQTGLRSHDAGKSTAAQLALRAHAWQVLNYLTDTAPQPGEPLPAARWERGWKNKCELGLEGANTLCGTPPTTDKEGCITSSGESHTLVEAAVQQGGKTAVTAMASVWYSPSAAAFVIRNCLNTEAGLRRLAAREAAGSPESQFPRDAIIVKLIWAQPAAKNPLGIWTPSVAGLVDRSPTADNVLKDLPSNHPWPRISVDLDDSKPCDAKSYRTNQDQGAAPGGDSVPINCFYHRSFPCSQMSSVVGEVVGWRAPCAPRGQDHFEAVLMGAHVITAELDDWTWITFWWTNQPATDAANQDQPASLRNRGPWGFYSMNTVVSAASPADKVDGGPPIIFNPYLEGKQENGPTSNCMYCHQMASFHPQGTAAVTSLGVTQVFHSGHPRRCAYLHPDDATCASLIRQDAAPDRVILPTDPSFKTAIHSHFIWSLSVAQDGAALKRGPVSLLAKPPTPGTDSPSVFLSHASR